MTSFSGPALVIVLIMIFWAITMLRPLTMNRDLTRFTGPFRRHRRVEHVTGYAISSTHYTTTSGDVRQGVDTDTGHVMWTQDNRTTSLHNNIRLLLKDRTQFPVQLTNFGGGNTTNEGDVITIWALRWNSKIYPFLAINDTSGWHYWPPLKYGIARITTPHPAIFGTCAIIAVFTSLLGGYTFILYLLFIGIAGVGVRLPRKLFMKTGAKRLFAQSKAEAVELRQALELS